MQRVLIVGATSSVAGDVARIYAKQGASMYFLARNEERLKALATELSPSVVGYESLDFCLFEKNGPALQRAIDRLGGIDIALVAHGLLGDQEGSESDFEVARQTIEANYLSAVSLLIPLAKHMESAGFGQIAAISSVAGLRGRPRNYTYGSAKGALSIYLQGLRSRLYPNVGVTTILLGPVDTPMTVDHEKNSLFISSEEAAQGIVRALSRKKAEAYVPGYWLPILWVVRGLPESIFQKISSLSGR